MINNSKRGKFVHFIKLIEISNREDEERVKKDE